MAENEMTGEGGREPGGEIEGAYKDSDFVLLDDLVYAPLHALANSDLQLRAHVVDALKHMGTLRQSGQEETVCLKNLNLAYDQVHQEDDDGYSVNNYRLQVPLLSIIPVSNLSVEEAEVEFSTEIKTEQGEEGDCRILARICAPEQRESDFLPKVSYKLKIRSQPATEGSMRLSDMFSTNQTAKRVDATPVAPDGSLGGQEQKDTWQEITALKAKIKKMRKLYQELTDMLEEQEHVRQIGEHTFSEGVYEFDEDKYRMVQSNIANRIMKYQEKIMNKKIELGLFGDEE